MEPDAKIPTGPLQDKWDHRFSMKLVNPINKRRFKIVMAHGVP
jgi:succinate dehydrogenase / fumarate reductase flavoprotein subunit